MAKWFPIKDAEAAYYAMDAGVSFWISVSEKNYVQAVMDAISAIGWVRSAF